MNKLQQLQMSITNFNSTNNLHIKITPIPADHLSQILFFLAHHRTDPILGIFHSEKLKYFFNFAITNMKYNNIDCSTFDQVQTNEPQFFNDKVCVIMDVPKNFQTMEALIKKLSKSKEIILILLQDNKKYINMMRKKIMPGQLTYTVTQYSTNGLIGINKKLRQLVDQSYDLNRAAFYAYGAYINNFRDNLLKFIFKTEALDVAALARSFGFTTPPRVKQGKFLKPQARKENLKAKLIQKKVAKSKPVQVQGENLAQLKKKRNLTSDEKIKALAAKKTKQIMKTKGKKQRKAPASVEVPVGKNKKVVKKKKIIS